MVEPNDYKTPTVYGTPLQDENKIKKAKKGPKCFFFMHF